MKFTMDETGKRGVITVEGGLTVRNIAEAKSFMLSSLLKVDTLRLDLDGLTEVDLCGLQLGCSLKRTASQMKKHVEYPESIPPALAKAAEEAGSCFHSGCDLAGERCSFSKRGLV
jgi:ABC-type transporter Mla MlaB component